MRSPKDLPGASDLSVTVVVQLNRIYAEFQTYNRLVNELLPTYHPDPTIKIFFHTCYTKFVFSFKIPSSFSNALSRVHLVEWLTREKFFLNLAGLTHFLQFQEVVKNNGVQRKKELTILADNCRASLMRTPGPVIGP